MDVCGDFGVGVVGEGYCGVKFGDFGNGVCGLWVVVVGGVDFGVLVFGLVCCIGEVVGYLVDEIVVVGDGGFVVCVGYD